MNKHAALINVDTNIVENIIVIDENTRVTDGYQLRQLEDRPEIGWIYDLKSDTFSEPPPPTPVAVVKLDPTDVAALIDLVSSSKTLSQEQIDEIKKRLESASVENSAQAATAQADQAVEELKI